MNEKLSITLPSELVAEIRDRVDSGRYASTSDMLEQAVQLLLGQEEGRFEPDLEFMRIRTRQSLDDSSPTASVKETQEHLKAHLNRLYGR